MHWTKPFLTGNLKKHICAAHQARATRCIAVYAMQVLFCHNWSAVPPWTLNIWTSTFGILTTYNALLTIYKHRWPTASVSVVLWTFFWHYKIQLFWDLWHWHKEKEVLLFVSLWSEEGPVRLSTTSSREHYSVMSPFDFITLVLHHPTELPQHLSILLPLSFSQVTFTFIWPQNLIVVTLISLFSSLLLS